MHHAWQKSRRGGVLYAHFPLAYTDSGAEDGGPTLVVIPGGPGFASVMPYVFYRPRIAGTGFRVVMVEHRGVGLSRHDAGGEDLPVDAMRAEYAARDTLAVLDRLGVERRGCTAPPTAATSRN